MSQDYGDIQHKRGDTAKNDAHTGPSGAISVDFQAKNLRVHDGVTAGGLFRLKSADDTDQAIAAVVDGAPSTLDTLRKLAAAINNDAVFHQTIQGLLNLKLNSAAYTAADVLAKIKTVDGAGSGLDADTLDGKQLATIQAEYQAYATQAVANLIDNSPAALDTLNELAAALGDDPNFAATMTTALGNKVDKVTGKALSTNDYTTAEKNKLAGIEAGAQVNVGTNLGIAGTGDSRQITSSTGSNVTVPVATTTNAGLMSTGDKAKLNGIEAGAQANVGTNLGLTGTGNSKTLTSSTGNNVALPVASTTDAGLMSTTDKSKLSGIEAGAQVNVGTNLGIAGTGDSRQITSSTGSNVTVPVATTTNAGLMSTGDKAKLAGIQAGAQVNPTNTETLAAVKAVDGAGSGLDADLLDGQHGSYYYSPLNPPPHDATLGFSQSFTKNGWQRMPSGLILQWGEVSVQYGVNISVPIQFPIAFPNEVLVGLSGYSSSQGEQPDSSSFINPTNESFTLQYTTNNTINTITWFAVGY